jgi:hypothetical protein
MLLLSSPSSPFGAVERSPPNKAEKPRASEETSADWLTHKTSLFTASDWQKRKGNFQVEATITPHVSPPLAT